MEAKIPIAFLAGFLSFVTPCVLPLVPGYLSRLGVEAGRLGQRDGARSSSAACRSSPASRSSSSSSAPPLQRRRLLGVGSAARRSPASCSSSLGLAFMGLLLPLPQAARRARARRRRAPQRLARPARRRVRRLRRAVHRRRPRPRAPARGDAGTVAAGRVPARRRTRSASRFRSCSSASPSASDVAFRWSATTTCSCRSASGAILVALGLLLFFDRFWWLRSGVEPRCAIFVGSLGASGRRRATHGSSSGDPATRGLELREHGGDVDAAVDGRVRAEPPQPPSRAGARSRAGCRVRLVPGDGDVHEPLEEVALRPARRARQASSSSSCASKYSPLRYPREPASTSRLRRRGRPAVRSCS